MFVKGIIAVAGTSAAATVTNDANEKVAFKHFASFTDCK